MARYIVTSRSHFQPFTYDELVKPLQQMTDVHNAAQDAYDQMTMDTNALDGYIDAEKDRDARRLYDNYRKRLRELQDNLWEYGLTPQTRKNLSDARASYANDIRRLQNAVTSRQEASNRYWDTAHKNPDMIMGIDPGTASLDEYLKDANYGNNWFSYNGNQFMKEVGIDAQARAAEIMGDPKLQKDVPGYITRIVSKGFSNQEVDDAIKAVRNGTVDVLPDGATKLLANTFASHLESTGAKVGQNISQEQYNRFFDYGHTGLVQGIDKPDVKDFTDNEYAFQQWKRQYNYSHPAPVNPTPTETTLPIDATKTNYDWGEAYLRVMGDEAVQTESDLNKTFHSGYTDGKAQLYLPGESTPHEVSSVTDATKLVEYNQHRNLGMERFDGLDVGDNKEQVSSNGYFRYKNGKIYTADENGKLKHYDENATQAYNLIKQAHEDYVKQVKAMPENKQLFSRQGLFGTKNVIMTPEEERKFREKYSDVPMIKDVPFEDLETAVKRAKVKDYMVTVPVFTGAVDEHGKDLQENILANIKQFNGNKPGDSNNKDKSEFAFYPVSQGKYDVAAEGTTELSDVFDIANDGSIAPSSLGMVYMLPEDVDATGRGNSRVRIRASKTVKGKNGQNSLKFQDWVVSAKALGPAFANAVNDTRFTQPMAYLRAPFTNPSEFLAGDDTAAAAWSRAAMPYMRINPANAPSAKDIIRNDAYWESYRRMIINWMTPFIAIAADNAIYGERKVPSATSGAQSYISR